MNKEEIEKYKIIKFLEENRQNKYGFIEMDCKDVCVLLDYINQLEKENKRLKEVIDKAIENIEMTQIRRYLLEQEEVVLEILKGGSNE